MYNTKVDSSKTACEVEEYIKQYYGLSDTISERYKIVTDFGILVDLLYGFRDEMNKKPKEETAKDLPDHGICKENNCDAKAEVDYNGHGHWVCRKHYESLSNYFDEEYR